MPATLRRRASPAAGSRNFPTAACPPLGLTLLPLLALAVLLSMPAAHAGDVRSADMLAHTCAGCHGTDGASAGAAMPTIAGFDKGYLVTVLTDYKTGLRPSTIMGRIMRGYTDQEIAAIAGWFAARPWVSTDRPVDGQIAHRGEQLHERACVTCHADGGRDQNDKAPRLAGQWAPYTRYALETCREQGLRCQPRKMAERVLELDDAELDALAHYYESQK